MADSAEGSGSNKWIYIGIGAVVLIGAGVGVYLMVSKKDDSASAGSSSPSPSLASAPTSEPATAKGNDYVSGEAIAKRSGGNYNAYQDIPKIDREKDKNDPMKMHLAGQYDAFWGAIDSNFGSPSTNEPLVRGFLKGMNLSLQRDYVGIFKPYIQKYLDNPAKKFHWEVTAGEFLK
jgi:hypothetical protein